MVDLREQCLPPSCMIQHGVPAQRCEVSHLGHVQRALGTGPRPRKLLGQRGAICPGGRVERLMLGRIVRHVCLVVAAFG